MIPLADTLVGEKGIFKSQSDLARQISNISPNDYPTATGVRALINQICLGQRKVPDKLRRAIIDLLNGKSDHYVSAIKKEIDNHNQVIVPMMRKAEPNARASCKNYAVQDRLCRALVMARFRIMFQEKPLEEAVALFRTECFEADPESGDGWESLFSDLLREIVREIK